MFCQMPFNHIQNHFQYSVQFHIISENLLEFVRNKDMVHETADSILVK